MTTPNVEDVNAAWETESGLIDDVDGYIVNAKFGVREEYAQAVLETSGAPGGLMILFDIADENGEVMGNQGYSVGTGWTPSDDGLSISHVKRSNVVTNTMYGQLQKQVVKELKVDMGKFGKPTEATCWNGLGFHWMQKPHLTVSGKEATGLMPTLFLGKKDIVAGAPATPSGPAAAPVTGAAAEAAAKIVAECGTVKEFQLKIVKVPEVVADDALMAQCLDDGPEGFFATNKK